MASLISAFLSVVPLATADLLAYVMLVLVAFFLVFGVSTAYYFWRQNKKAHAETPSSQG
ncbi:MAG: hypothetical protein JRM73_01930 [Nitrososphaerota archaeon]|nr:hypothetical protein [Nitrososphaerota archaeon]